MAQWITEECFQQTRGKPIGLEELTSRLLEELLVTNEDEEVDQVRVSGLAMPPKRSGQVMKWRMINAQGPSPMDHTLQITEMQPLACLH